MCVVNKRVNLSIKATSRIDNIKSSDASFHRQCGQFEFIAIVLSDVFFLRFSANTRVNEERAIYIKILRRVLNQCAPVLVDIPLKAGAESAVFGFVLVRACNGIVVCGLNNNIGIVNKLRSISDGISIDDLSIRRERCTLVIDPSTLCIAIANKSQGHVVTDG